MNVNDYVHGRDHVPRHGWATLSRSSWPTLLSVSDSVERFRSLSPSSLKFAGLQDVAQEREVVKKETGELRVVVWSRSE